MFSSRVAGDLEPNRLTRAVLHARANGRAFLDLTVSNPTRVGLRYPADLLQPLSKPAAHVYEPDSRGVRLARAAVTRDYARRGISVATDRLVLTASTSEAYSILFKLLCAPAGDVVLVPTPSYPLFDHLTRLDGVAPISYRLEYHGRWSVDESSVDEAWSGNVRAVLAVNPNNPTGSVLSHGELRYMSARCAAQGAALIVDEVFADYNLADADAAAAPGEPTPDHRRTDHHDEGCLVFRLGGLSKSAGLPQVKLGWIAVGGPDALAAPALERLELICDTYLSVSTPVQVAAPELIARGAEIRAQILERIRGNYAALQAIAASEPSVGVLHADAGWSAVVRIPSTRSEEDFVLHLLERQSVLVHPGFFFDFPHEAFVVVSLLPEPDVFAEGVRRMLECVHA